MPCGLVWQSHPSKRQPSIEGSAAIILLKGKLVVKSAIFQSGFPARKDGVLPCFGLAACKCNGPAYVRGPVTVVGEDIYDLDRDHDRLRNG